jgi:hypothetical protein
MTYSELEFRHPELMRKISNAHNLKGRVRKVTNDEVKTIKNLDEWRDGYFPYGGGLMCLEKRENGQYVIFTI